MNTQAYVNAIGEMVGGQSTWSIGTVKTGDNSIVIPGSDPILVVNFDNPKFKLNMAQLGGAVQKAEAALANSEKLLAALKQVSGRIDYFMGELAKAGVTGIDKTDLLFILFDAASVRDWGFCPPEVQAIIDKLAPVPPAKK